MSDRLSVVLCALGAALLLVVGIGSTSAYSAILFAAAFYGLHRALRSGIALAFIGAPVLAWTLGQVNVFAPEKIAAESASKTASQWFARLLMSIAIAWSVVLARHLVGRGLAMMTASAICSSFLARTIALLPFSSGSTPVVLSEATARGWSSVGGVLAAVCWFLIALAPEAPPALPRSGGAITGAIGATLFVALLDGFPETLSSYDADVSMVGIFLVAIAWVLFAIGMGAVGKLGVTAGWVALALAIVQILAIPAAIGVFKEGKLSLIVAMSLPFALLGLGITALAARALPLRPLRIVVGSAALTCATASVLTWLLTALTAANVARMREPWLMIRPIVAPAASIALLAWAAYLLYVATPPAPRASA